MQTQCAFQRKRRENSLNQPEGPPNTSTQRPFPHAHHLASKKTLCWGWREGWCRRRRGLPSIEGDARLVALFCFLPPPPPRLRLLPFFYYYKILTKHIKKSSSCNPLQSAGKSTFFSRSAVGSLGREDLHKRASSPGFV